VNSGWRQRLSLQRRGARPHLAVAAALVLVIPLLSFAFVVVASTTWTGTYSIEVQALICLLALGLGSLGYTLLRRFPKNIENLRGYLKDIASGELPAEVRLGSDTDDITAIARYLNLIVNEMRQKVSSLEKQLALSRAMQDTIRRQEATLLIAERHRVMIESLGAACHHIGQPATVLKTSLSFLDAADLPEKDREALADCRSAIDQIVDILTRLNTVSEYRTVPYLTSPEAPGDGASERIIDINA